MKQQSEEVRQDHSNDRRQSLGKLPPMQQNTATTLSMTAKPLQQSILPH